MKKILSVILALALMVSLCACDSMDYKKAMSAYEAGNYQEAREIFLALGEYEDSADMVTACDYQLACQLLEEGKYEEAMAAFTALGDYEDSADMVTACDYQLACQLLEEGNFSEAAAIFKTLGNYENSRDKLEACRYAEIDALLQGRWQGNLLGIIVHITLNNGRFSIDMSSGAASSHMSDGTYRIDLDDNGLYLCIDQKVGNQTIPGTTETKLFVFSYDGTNFKFENTIGNTFTRE